MALKFYKDALGKLKPETAEKSKEVVGKPAEKFLRLAITLPKIKANVTKKIKGVIEGAGYGYKVKPEMPLALPVKSDPDKVRVYPNIKANFKAEDVLEYITKILKDPKTEVRFATPERAVKLALKWELTTFAKLVADYTNLKELGYGDAQVRDLAKMVSDSFLPSAIVVCNSVRDYYTMYKTKVPGSCMGVGNDYWGDISRKVWPKVADDTGVYPSAWYHYQPYAKGCYLMVDGKPVARWMIYRKNMAKDEYPYYGDVKCVSAAYRTQVIEAMKKQGKTELYSMDTLCDYRVPAVYHEALGDVKVPWCPLPNCDNQRKDFSVCYDETAGDFVFGLASKHADWTRVGSTYNYKGYIPGNKIVHINKIEAPVVEPPKVEEVLPPPVVTKKPAAKKKVEEAAVVAEVKPKARRGVKPKGVVEVDLVRKVEEKVSAVTYENTPAKTTKKDNAKDTGTYLITIE